MNFKLLLKLNMYGKYATKSLQRIRVQDPKMVVVCGGGVYQKWYKRL